MKGKEYAYIYNALDVDVNSKIDPNQQVWSLKDHQVLEVIIWI